MPRIFLKSFLLFLTFSFRARKKWDRQNESYASRKRISHILFLLLYPSPFFITVWFEARSHGRRRRRRLAAVKPIPRFACNGGVPKAAHGNYELKAKEETRGKFARLPPGMMNEPLYLFCSQISFRLLKKRDARNSTRGLLFFFFCHSVARTSVARYCRDLLDI